MSQRRLFQRLRRRQDSEHEQALVRVAIVGLLFAYVSVAALGAAAGPAIALLVCLGAAYFALSLVYVALIVAWPSPSPVRRVAAMVTDFAVLSGFLYLGDEAAAPFYAVYLWVAFGNGFRYGLPYLAASVAMAAGGFFCVALTTDFWIRERPLAIGLLVGLVVLPGYAATLIRKLTEAKAQAEAANQAKGRFVASVSHELRTPLNAIIGTSELIDDSRLDRDQRDMVRTIKTAGTTLLALIDDVLDLSRIEANRATTDAVDFDLHATLAEVISLFRTAAADKGLTLAATIAPTTPWRLRGDAKHLRQILTNLIGNAIKFTDSGRVVLRVDPAGTNGDDESGEQRLRFTVSDTGIGIPTHQHERIFGQFSQADEAVNRRYGGTGLGLPISRSLAELSGGTLTLSSVPGEGSTFTLEIPFAPASLPEQLPTVPPPRAVVVSRDPAMADGLRVELAIFCVDAVVAEDVDAALAIEADVARVAIVDDRKSVAGEAIAGALKNREQGAAMVFIRIGGDRPEVADPNFLVALDWPPSEESLANALHAAGCFAGGSESRTSAAAPEINAAPRPSRRALRVLVAEDNPVNRRLTERILARGGFRPRLVESGEDALDALDAEPFDAVLLDINMPGVSGLDVVKLHRMASLDLPRIPFIALSADATVETREAAIAAGVDLYLTKPVEPHRLIEEIDRIVPSGDAAAEEIVPPPLTDFAAMTIAGTPDNSEPSILDRDAIDALDAYGGPDEAFGLSILSDFAANTESLLHEIRDSAREGDAIRFRAAVHALRGTSGNIGAQAMRQYCQGLQGMTPERLGAHGAEYVRQFELEFGRLRREIGRYISETVPRRA